MFPRALVVATLLIDFARGQIDTPELKAADSRIVRLPPNSFRGTPPAVRAELVRRRCTIPQTYVATRPQGVIRGEFIRRGQVDWAALCSVNRVSTILVFPNGESKGLMEVARERDIDKIQGIGGGRLGYSRCITTVSPSYILGHFIWIHPHRPRPVILHDGIDGAFIEKASVVRYFARGQWIELPGAD